MSTAAIAVIPSNQDRNVSPLDPTYIEEDKMVWYADQLVLALNKIGSIEARYFIGTSESKDSPPGSLSGLIQQQEWAERWLDSVPALAKFALNLHTNYLGSAVGERGDYVCAIYGKNGDKFESKSYDLAWKVARQLSFAMNLHVLELDYSSYIFYTKIKYVSALIEMGSHDRARSLEILKAHPSLIVDYLVRGCVDYANGLGANL